MSKKKLDRPPSGIYGLVLLAFGLRLRSLARLEFHIDEFFSMLGAQMTAQKGAPILPSGLLYDHGLLFSYLDGFFIRFFGFSETMARWPSVLVGVLAVASTYALGRRLFHSPWVGLMAALALALNEESIIWGGRARMLMLAQLVAIWTIFLLWWSLRSGGGFKRRLGFVAAYLATLLSHLAAIILLPGLAAGGVALKQTEPNRQVRALIHWRRLWREGLLLALAVGLAVGLGVVGQLPSTLGYQDFGQVGQEQVLQPGGGFLAIPSDVGAAGRKLSQYFLEAANVLFLLLIALGLGGLIWRTRRRRWREVDAAWLYLLAVWGGTLFVFALFVDPHWQRTRYLTALLLPAFYCLGAGGLRYALEIWPGRVTSLLLPGATILVALLSVRPVLPLLSPGEGGHLRYDLAFNFVKTHWQDGDRVMAEQPAASYLYLARNDLYFEPDSAKVLWREGVLVDRYTGALWVESVDELLAQLAQPGRLWLVTRESWFFRQFDPYFLQQVLWQMDKVYFSHGIWGLVSRDDRWPLAEAPTTLTDYRFADGTVLGGYTLEPMGNLLRLTLYWQPGEEARRQKVFVHLRNEANETVAQSDHWLYHGAVPEQHWPHLLAGGEPARDGVQLFLPDSLPAGTYRLLLGFYHPDTWERLPPVIDDSGEAAVVLFEFEVND